MAKYTNKLPETLRSERWLDILGVVALALLALKLTYNIDRVMDIAVSDEGRYLAQGTRLLELGFPSPQWAPLYALWYFGLSRLSYVRDAVQLYYLNFILLSVSTPILLYIYLRRVAVISSLALLTSWLYLISFSNINAWPFPTKFAIFCVISLLIVATFVPRSMYYFMLLVILLVISFVRPEYAPAFVIAVAFGVGRVLVQAKRQGGFHLKAALAQGVLLAVATAVLIHFMGNPLAGNRNLQAFSQHFSINYTSWTASTASPWVNNDAIMQEVFGEADSMLQVARANPRMLVRHILTNAAHYPKSLIDTVFDPPFLKQLRSKSVEAAVNFMLVGLVLLAIAISVGYNFWYRRSMTSGEKPSGTPPLLPALRNAQNSHHVCLVGLLFLFVSLSALASALLIYPRYHYLQIQGILFLILGALLVSNTIALYKPIEAQPRRSAIGLAIIGVMLILITPSPVYGWTFGAPKQGRTDIYNTVSALKRLDIQEPVIFVAFGGSPNFSYDIYLGDTFRKIPSTRKKEDFDAFLKRYSINMVIWPEQLLNDARFQNDSKFKEFLDDPERFGFISLTIPRTNGQHHVLLKDTLKTARPVPDATKMAAQAKELADAGDYEAAAQIYRDLVDIDFGDQRSRMGLAESLAKAGHHDEAMAEFNAIVSQWPNAPWGYIRRGELSEASGDYEGAFADYKRAAALAPDLADPHFRLGFVYMHNNDHQAAIREFEAGLALDPTRERPRKALETLLATP